MFEFFIKNNPISSNQSVLNKVTHAYISFYLLHLKYINPLMTILKVFFLTSSKLSIKLDKKGLTFKLKQNGRSADVPNILIDNLNERKKRAISGQIFL